MEAGEKRGIRHLVFAGVFTEAVYVVYVFLFPLLEYGHAGRPYDLEQISRGQRWQGGVYAVGVPALFLFYLAALRADVGGRAKRRVVAVFGLLFAFTLIFLYPVTATDLFQYVLRARVGAVYGHNPLSVPPSISPDDPLLPFAGEWQGIVSPYGPVWESITFLVVAAGADGAVSGAVALKLVAVAFYALCMYLVWWVAGSRGKDAEDALLFFAWNPLVLLEGPGNGHNDMVVLAFMLACFVLWRRGWPNRGVAALTLSALVKATAALVGPLFVAAVVGGRRGFRSRLLAFVGLAAVGLLVATAAYLPFWPPWENVMGVLAEFGRQRTYAISSLVRHVLRFLEVLGPRSAEVTPRLTATLIFLGFYAWLLVKTWRGRLDVFSAGFLAYFAQLMLGGNFRIWYPVWLVPLAALSAAPSARLRTVLFCLTSELSILSYYLLCRWYFPELGWFGRQLITTPWVYGIPLFVPLFIPLLPPVRKAEQ